MSRRGTLIKVSIFAVTMLLVSAGLVVVFGEFRFASTNTYHATFTDAARLKGGNDVRIAGVPVGSVGDVKLNPDNTVDVAFTVNKKYQMYTSTRALIRYENLVGDRYMEITSGPGELRKLPPGGTVDINHTQPALGSRCSARWPAPGGQGPRRRASQPDHQCDPRAVAGRGRRAVAIALGDWNIQPNLGRSLPGDLGGDPQSQRGAGDH